MPFSRIDGLSRIVTEDHRLSNFRHWAQYNVAEAHRAVSVPLPLVSKRREAFEPDLPALGWSPDDEAEPDTEVYDRASAAKLGTERDLPASSPRNIETFEEFPPPGREPRTPLRAEDQRRLLTLIVVGILAVVTGVVALLFLRPQPATLIMQSTPTASQFWTPNWSLTTPTLQLRST